MPYALVALLVLIAFAIFAGCRREAAPDDSDSASTRSAPAAPGSKAAIERRLRDLSRSPAPTELTPGAMCYETAMPPPRVEFVCDVCGEKTLYPWEGPGEWPLGVVETVEWDLPTGRRLVTQIHDLNVALDSTEFCHACSPNTTEPRLVLVVTYPDGTVQRTRGVESEDLRLVLELLSGSAVHDGDQGGETPLKQHLPRLEQLLGVSLAGED